MLAAALSFLGREPLIERRIVQRRVLATDRIVDRLFEAVRPDPFFFGADNPVGANLIEAPIDLEAMTVGIAKLDRDLRAGAAPALEIDRPIHLLQVIAREDHLIERSHLESDVIELDRR